MDTDEKKETTEGAQAPEQPEQPRESATNRGWGRPWGAVVWSSSRKKDER
jgi:hypothetical protein